MLAGEVDALLERHVWTHYRARYYRWISRLRRRVPCHPDIWTQRWRFLGHRL